MAALHEALKTLGPTDFSETDLDDLKPFLAEAFAKGQLIVDSVPIPAPSDDSASPESRSRSNTASSNASSASEISLSSARSAPPPPDVEALQKEWKPIKLNPKENPLGMNVYKLAAKDGRGSWFARRSVHEGLGFTKWKKGLEKEFPETMKVQGGPGEGNVRGIGGERRVEYKVVNGVGKMEVFLLSAQFPGPTTPRDFVTMYLTSDQALSDYSGGQSQVPRHFMVISKPCIHSEAPPRDGYVRGSYESVEFIREIPLKPVPQKSASTTNLGNHSRSRSSTLGREAILRNARKHSSPEIEDGFTTQEKASEPDHNLSPSSEGRARGKTISFDRSRGFGAKGEDMDVPREDDECESNPIEWIMITRSDPGGSVPRFMVERGTPGGIVSDASKFLNWACAKDIEDFESDVETLAGDDQDENAQTYGGKHDHERDLHNYQTNGHLAGLEESSHTASSETATTNGQLTGLEDASRKASIEPATAYSEIVAANGVLYRMVSDAATAAGAMIAAHSPHAITDHLPNHVAEQNAPLRRESVASITSESSVGSFASALENTLLENNSEEACNDAASTITTESQVRTKDMALKDKELQRLEDKKRKLDERLSKVRERELSKKSEDSAKEEEALKKAEERHEREVKKQQEKYQREVERLEKKKAREEQKAEERRKKAAEKDERTRLLRELEEVKAEVGVLRKEKEMLRGQVGDLQAENTALAAKVGRLGMQGEVVLREVRDEVNRSGRSRASSLKGFARPASFRSRSTEREKDPQHLAVPTFS